MDSVKWRKQSWSAMERSRMYKEKQNSTRLIRSVRNSSVSNEAGMEHPSERYSIHCSPSVLTAFPAEFCDWEVANAFETMYLHDTKGVRSSKCQSLFYWPLWKWKRESSMCSIWIGPLSHRPGVHRRKDDNRSSYPSICTACWQQNNVLSRSPIISYITRQFGNRGG